MITLRRRRPARAIRAVLLALLAAVLVLSGSLAAAGPQTSYRNAVSDAFSDTYADPAVIQGKDGWWYVYATADPLKSGGEFGYMHVARTRDWSDWQYLGTIFDEQNLPDYVADGGLLWAPDIRYIDGQYVLYFTVTDTTLNPGGDPGIGVATAQSPTGPWTTTDEPIIEPRPRPGGSDFLGTIDPAGFTDVDGQNYLYFGGYNGGFWGVEVSEDGLTAQSQDYTRIAVDDRYEGGYVVRHGGWYYFMASTANCCAGPTTGYSVYTGRSKSPLGPFVDDEGRSLLDSYAGGTNMIMQNGNRWIGVGHHSVATDAEGRDWMVYHGLDRNKPWLNEPFGINRRPTLIDPIDWIDGWPRVRAGAGPSDDALPAPVTTSGLGIVADDPARSGFRGLKAGPRDRQAGATAVLRGHARTTRSTPEERVRVRLDLAATDRRKLPVIVRLGDHNHQVKVIANRASGRLMVETTAGEIVSFAEDELPDAPRWQTLVIEVDQESVSVTSSESDLGDPAAEVRLDTPGLRLPSAPVRLTSPSTLLDNFTVREPVVEATEMVSVPERGDLVASDEFDSRELADWDWVRKNDDVTVSDGSLNWPVEDTELVGDDNDAAVLLQDPPSDRDWIAETKLNLDLGTDERRNFQQAGMIAYRSDDDFARLSKVAIQQTRQVEYGRELVETADGRTSFGGSIQSTPGKDGTWLRLAHHLNSDGEHLYRAAVSTDGKDWTWGGVWTFESGESPRIGLFAHGGAKPAVDARFDYFRVYETEWPDHG